jgi:Mechanosensitive ion channel
MPTRSSFAAICFALFVFVWCALGADSPPDNPNSLPSKHQVLAFLIETIEWYRHLSAEQQMATEPANILLLEDSRALGAQVVRFSFDFAKAVAAFETTPSVLKDSAGRQSPALGPDFQHFLERGAQSETESQQVAADLSALQAKRLVAHRADRSQLDAEIADTQSRLELLGAISTSYQNLLDFVRETNAGPTEAADLEAFVESLEKTVPEVSSSDTSTVVLPQNLTSAAADKGPASGVLGLISGVTSISKRRHALDDSIRLTDNLIQNSHSLQTPLAKPLTEALRNPELVAGSVEASNVAALQEQEVRLKALTAEATKLTPAIAALAKQRVLLTLYQTRLSSWRASIAKQYTGAWKKLIIALASLAAAIAFLVASGVALRKFTAIHIHDANNRRVILIGQHLLLWITIILIVLFAFAFNLSSLATFLGLVSAGIAVAMQNVILAVVGYFLLVGKLRVRIGDRVQISGVAGEVVDIGLMQFQLKEFDSNGERPTGRVVSFSNSFVFVSPATGLFKRIQPAASS